MSHDPITTWVEKAKNQEAPATEEAGVQVIRRVTSQNRGSLIMSVAEAIRPWLMKKFEGARDNDGMLVQPAHVRAIALSVAQDIIKNEEQKASA